MRLFEFFSDLKEKELLLMGGNAFKHIELIRINRKDIDATLLDISKKLKIPRLTYEYLKNNLMGSVGKQPTSGDIDIALDKRDFNLRTINLKAREVLGNNFVHSKGVKGGQLNVAWPIAGNVDKGYIQVDFISGNPEWLKFSHHSPGEISKYKGVYISTMLGILSKMMKDYELYDPDTEERIARVGLGYNLEQGLKRFWKLQRRPGQGLSKVDPDYWESNVKTLDNKLPPRFDRIGRIDDPKKVVDILLPGITPDQIGTFEDLWNIIKNHLKWKDNLNEIKERFMDAVNRSSAIKNTDLGKAMIPDIFEEI